MRGYSLCEPSIIYHSLLRSVTVWYINFQSCCGYKYKFIYHCESYMCLCTRSVKWTATRTHFFYLHKGLYMYTSIFYRGSILYFFWKSCCLIPISNHTNRVYLCTRVMYDRTEIHTDKLNALIRNTDWNHLTTRVTQVMLKQFHFYLWKLDQIKKRIPKKKTISIRPKAKPWLDSTIRKKIRLRHRARNKAVKWYFRLTKSSSLNYMKQQTHGPNRSPNEQFQSKLWLYQNIDIKKKNHIDFLIPQ